MPDEEPRNEEFQTKVGGEHGMGALTEANANYIMLFDPSRRSTGTSDMLQKSQRKITTGSKSTAT
jgi:hypothetical protein